MASQRQQNLSELMRSVASVDIESVDKKTIKQLYLDVVYRCLEEDVNPKAMEVALRALAGLAEMLDEDPVNSLDDELRSKMPDNVLSLIERQGKAE